MKEAIAGILKKALEELDEKVKLKQEEIVKFIEIPPSPEMGDYAFPCFFLADKLKKSPHEIALEIRGKIKTPPLGLEGIQTSGPYINFFLDRKKLAEDLIKGILAEKDRFGKSNVGKENKTMIEFSQPNTHKAFHIGHIRGTSLGESISRISEFCGEKVIRANYSGDTGMHIAKWLWCYQKYHSREKLKDDESWIASIYVDAVKRLAKTKTFQMDVNEINRRLTYNEDKKLTRLWEKTRKMSAKSWKRIYTELNTKFDIHFFESEMEKRGKKIAENLLKNKIAKKSDGAVIMNLKKYHLGVLVLLRQDGTVLYSAKDLALAEKKMKSYKLDKSIIIIGNEQDTYSKQLFKTLEITGLDTKKIFRHVPFGMVRLPTGTMSSRTGNNILYSNFMKDIIDYSKKEIKKREAKITKKELDERALKVSIAAIKYSMLKQSSNKNIIFRKKEALNFEGDTGPYILYSYARASSILRKAKQTEKQFKIKNLEPKEIELVKKLSQFSEIILNSYENLNPSLIANYSYQLAHIFNEFYHSCPVIGSEQEKFRLLFVDAFRQVLKNSLNLLGIETIERM